MYIRDLVASLVRRWYLTLGGLVVTAGLVFLALQIVPPSYETKASIVLLPPKSTVERGGNPYLQLGGLSPTMDLLRVALTDQAMSEKIKAVSGTAEYTVEADASSSGPVLVINAQDRTAAGSLSTRDALLQQAPLKLQELQSSLDIPTSAHITTMVLSQDARPEIAGRNQMRAVVVAGGAGVVGTVLLVGFVDGSLGSRRRRGAARSDGGHGERRGPEQGAPGRQVVVASEWDRSSAEGASRGRRSTPASRRAKSSSLASNEEDGGASIMLAAGGAEARRR